MLKTIGKVLALFVLPVVSFAQQQTEQGQVHGNFQVDVQTYREDTRIGITDSSLAGEKAGMNGFGQVIYTRGDFTLGMRFETYLNPLSGFDDAYAGTGVPYRFASFKKDEIEVTLGNFYEQFGSGMVLRTYEEWSLGYDNSLDGLRVKYHPTRGVTLKGIYGTQRQYWLKAGLVRGADAEVSLNELVEKWKNKKTQVIFGGSLVSKYEKDNPFYKYKLPENVSAFAGRLSVSHGKFNILSEYAHKINDPSALNNHIYRDGQGLIVTANYSQKGLGISLTGKRIDNMSFKSKRDVITNILDINFLPPIAKQHAYSLQNMYPYATQPNGEMGVQGQVIYTIPKKTRLGGKYGTGIALNYSRVYGIDRTAVNDTTPVGDEGTMGYESEFFTTGQELYFDEFNVELTKKFSPAWKIILAYTNLVYNFGVIEEGFERGPKYYANIGVADITWNKDKKNSFRLEMQYLSTRQDSGKWACGMIEYTIAPKWFFAVMDQYNFDNPVSDNTYHYYMGSVGYINKTNRIALSYGRQREGILCVGGVCRRVPAASGFTITITSSF